MAVTEQTAQFLESLVPTLQPSVTEVGIEAVREAYRSIPELGMPAMHAVDEVDVPVGGAATVTARVYRPDAGDEPRPVLCYFHAGGWTVGALTIADGPCRRLAAKVGAVVVAPAYRQAPEHPFPTAAEDALAVTAWAADHSADLGGDASRLAVMGASAGGNLAAVVPLMARDRGGPALAAQVLDNAVLDADLTRPSYVENAEGFMLTRADMAFYWDQYVPDPGERRHPYAAPLQADDLAGLPPAFVVTAEHDPLRDEGEAYAAALADAGVPTTVRRWDGVIHGFVSTVGLVDEAEEAEEEIADFLRAALAAPPT